MKFFVFLLEFLFIIYDLELGNCFENLIEIGHHDSNRSSIHRFFDTSPFSPSGRYVAFTRMSDKVPILGRSAEIIVYDIATKVEHEIDTTKAWDSQIGAHVQWGINDSQLFYNKLEYLADDNNNHKEIIYGVIYDLFNKKKRRLECPVYQVSPDGLWTAAPDLSKIGFTQKGYGVHIRHPIPNTIISQTDGLFKTDVLSGKCKLIVPLTSIAKHLKLPLSTPLYGFHTKWSSDSNLIMFIVRSLHSLSSSALSLTGLIEAVGLVSPGKTRVQHVFVCDANGRHLRHVLSYGSHPIDPHFPDLLNGNHPNWVPNTHCMSMNRQMPQSLFESAKVFALSTSNFSARSSDFFLFTIYVGQGTSTSDRPYRCTTAPSTSKFSAVGLNGRFLYPSTGHPSVLAGGRFVLTDAYPKETHRFSGLRPGHVPILLIDLQRLTHALLKQVASAKPVKGPWRCDLHPVLSRDLQWLAYNGLATDNSGVRKVFLMRIQRNLTSYF